MNNITMDLPDVDWESLFDGLVQPADSPPGSKSGTVPVMRMLTGIRSPISAGRNGDSAIGQ